MSECENAGTYANTRKAWGEFQTHIDTNIVEVTDNFISNNVDVKLWHKNVNGEMVFIAEGPSSVENVSRMFCLGQPTEDHGGVHNEKGHGLKVFQAYTGTDSLTFVRKETDLSRKMSEMAAQMNAQNPNMAAQMNAQHPKEYEHWIIRYGPRHDDVGKAEGEPAIIKTTKAKIDIEKGEILDCPVQQRLVVENLLSRDHPFADKNKSYSYNIASLVNVFKSFPKDGGEYLMFMYYGFNKQWSYMQNRPVPKFTPLADGDILLNGTSKCSEIMASMYAHSLMLSSIYVGDKKIVSHDPQDYNMSQALWESYSNEHIGSFKMKAAFHHEFLNRDAKFTLKHGKLDTAGTWLYYNTRMINKKSSFFETLYDDVMGSQFGQNYVSFTKLMSLTGGGKQHHYVKNEMQKYANHLGVDVSELPFTYDEFDRIYRNFGKFVKVKRGGAFCLLGFATRFEISSDFFVFDVSKEKISYHLRNKCDLWKLLQKIRWQQLKWCFDNICKINSDALTTIPPEIQSSSTSSSSAIQELDDSSDEEEVTCDVTPTTSGRSRKKTALVNVASFTVTNVRKKSKPRITYKSLLTDLKTIMKKHLNIPPSLKKDLTALISRR